MNLKQHLEKHHAVLSIVVKDLARIKTFYPELYAKAVDAFWENKKELAKLRKKSK